MSIYNNLDETLDYVRSQMSRAVVDNKHQLRQIFVSTFGVKYPEVRTVVLRKVDWQHNLLFFHTDCRSKKYSELFQNSNISILGYCHKKRYQVRFRGQVFFDTRNEAAKQSWLRLSDSSKMTYSSAMPGLPILKKTDDLYDLHHQKEFAANTQDGFDNFVSVGVVINEIEWLHLTPEGHSRALFKFIKDQKNPDQQMWLQP